LRSHAPLEEFKTAVKGVLAFPITPYGNDGNVDLEAVARNARWFPETGVAAVVAPSGTGELPSLAPEECVGVTRAMVEAMEGRLPVIAGVGFGARVAAELAGRAEEAGAAGLMVMPPYYQAPSPNGLVEYCSWIADRTELPLIAYVRDSAVFTPESLVRLVREVPTVVGFKEGRADIRLFQRLRSQVGRQVEPGRLVWLAGAGDDVVGPFLAAGAEGFTSSLAAFWPEPAVRMFELAATGDYPAIDQLQERVVRPIYELRQRRPGFEVAVMKSAMEMLGYVAGPVRPPLENLGQADREDLRAVLAALDVPKAGDRDRAMLNASAT
jgi:5-dehydro-4-deoxyglucarate dehydratase